MQLWGGEVGRERKGEEEEEEEEEKKKKRRRRRREEKKRRRREKCGKETKTDIPDRILECLCGFEVKEQNESRDCIEWELGIHVPFKYLVGRSRWSSYPLRRWHSLSGLNRFFQFDARARYFVYHLSLILRNRRNTESSYEYPNLEILLELFRPR